MMTIAYPVRSGVYVNLTNRCPCACTFCLRQNGPGVYGSNSLWLEREPTVEETIESIESTLDAETRELVFCGYGEPTERLADMLTICRAVKAKHPTLPIRVNTNGLADLIHGRATANDFKGLVDTISVSLNTDDAEEYLKMCRPKFGAESYGAMKKFASEAAEVVPNVVMTVVDEPVTSKEKQERCRAIAESLGAKLRVRPFEE